MHTLRGKAIICTLNTGSARYFGCVPVSHEGSCAAAKRLLSYPETDEWYGSGEYISGVRMSS